MVAPTYLAHSGAQNTGSSVTVATPIGVADGDVMFAWVTAYSGIFTMTGWEKVYESTTSGPNAAMFRKTAGPSEPASHTVNSTSSSATIGVDILAFRDAGMEFNYTTGLLTDADSFYDVTLTTTKADCELVVFAAINASASFNLVTAGGFTERFDHDYGYAQAGFERAAALAGSYSVTFNTSSAGSGNAYPYVGFALPPRNVAPNAPILTAPADGATIDRNIGQRFDWDFSDPDAGDSQSKYDLRYRRTDVAKNEIQTVTITGGPTGGTFTLTFDGQTTASISWDATAAAVQTALEGLSNIGVGDVSCTGGPLPGTAVTVEFTGALGNTNVAQMTATSSLTGGTSPAVTVATTQEGVPLPAWTDVTNTTPNTYHDFAGGTFAAGDYEWQVRTYDAQGVVGPYSASGFFTAANAPADLTITYPSNGGTVQQAERVDWSTPTQDSFQVRRVADNAGAADTATVYYDSGEVVSTTARTQALTFETNDRYEHVQVRIKDAGLWSAWASVRVNVSYTPPAAPTVSLMALDDEASLWVSISNPTPTGGQPSVEYNSVEVNDGDGWERKVTNWATNTGWQYRTPVGGRDYSGNVRVTAHASNRTTATTTVPAGAAPTTTDYYGGGYE